MVKIYTRTGDKGQTSLYGGKRVSKSSLRIETIGTVDELNSAIGAAIAGIRNKELGIRKELEKIQNDLFTIGAVLASPSTMNNEPITNNVKIRVIHFEKLIDQLTKKLPELRNFILPGGRRAGAALHLARSICRRAERRLVELSKKETVPNHIFIYFNRLSDLLFTMARFVNYQEKQKETIWQNK
ncbi:MAG: cob(I)yrinic acid a,c-diamide adenosyltransferase [Candidatus Levybacteria bacterium]|nr:cob(I)yrinic acid a,c-diamide adenosyltransferase [Candidatus Levybacteria bacterium]